MKIRYHFLKLKARIYFNILVFLGAMGFMFSSGCSCPTGDNANSNTADSLAAAKAMQDSITKADSLAQAEHEKFLQDSIVKADSIARADSIAKALIKPPKKPNPYKPNPPVTKYGVPYNRD